MDKTFFEFIGAAPVAANDFSRVLGKKSFEGTNHLGNILTILSDIKIPGDNNADGITDYYKANLLSATDYYPFGVTMQGRDFNSSDYRFGFNGKEKDDEVSGSGNQYDYGFRIYNPRLGRFLSVDPLSKEYPWYTPYQFAGNMPIWAVDLDGLEELKVTKHWDGKTETIINSEYTPGPKPYLKIITETTTSYGPYKAGGNFLTKRTEVEVDNDFKLSQMPPIAATPVNNLVQNNNAQPKLVEIPKVSSPLVSSEPKGITINVNGKAIDVKPGTVIQNQSSSNYYSTTGALGDDLSNFISELAQAANNNPEISSITVSAKLKIGPTTTANQQAVIISAVIQAEQNIVSALRKAGLSDKIQVNINSSQEKITTNEKDQSDGTTFTVD